MTPFQQFRIWAKRAPSGERGLTAAVAVVILFVASWSLVSVGGSGRPETSGGTRIGLHATGSGGSGGGRSAGGGSSRAGNGGGGGGTSDGFGSGGSSSGGVGVSTGSGGGSGSAADGAEAGHGAASRGNGSHSSGTSCGSSGSTDQGVTSTQIHIDVDVADLAGQAGNSLVGLPTAQVEQQMFAAAIAGLNKDGGVRCRHVVAKYYTANPLLQSSLQSLCLRMVSDHPFALLDEGLGSPVGATTPRDCPPSHQLPEFGSLSLSEQEVRQFSPYLMGYPPTEESVVNDAILAAHSIGWFNGAKRVGLIEQDCNRNLNTLALADLARIGFPKAKITTFDFGCPNAIPSPIAVRSAVLQFKAAGVTNVFDDGGVYENYFSKTAAGQDYHPKYAVGDQGSIALWDNRNFGPDPQNFNGALAVTPTQYGAENTPGSRFSKPTTTCNRWMTAAHLPTAQKSPDAFSGVACTLVMMFAEAADNAPQLARNQLSAGLMQVGHAEMPFPAGPANFERSQGQTGGGYWRTDNYFSSCACFRVTRPTFRPSYS
jgi:hypothetical protein